MKIFYTFFLVILVSCISAQNLSSGLTACYALDGNADDPINNLNGTLSAVTPTADRFGNANSAYYFSGALGSYIGLPNSPLIKPDVLSASCWVWLNNVTQSQELIFAHNGCMSYHEGYQLSYEYQSIDGVTAFQVVKADSTCHYYGQIRLAATSLSVSAQTWYQLGFYAGPDSLKLYVNGLLISSMANPNALVYNSGANVYLGNTNLAFNFPLTGMMDNVRFYNRKLTDGEMYQLYLQDPSCKRTAASLAENADDSDWNIYPNPVSSQLTLERSAGETGNITLSNVIGEMVLEQKAVHEKMVIDLSQLSKGIYFLKTSRPGSTKIYKIIKE